jgi:serine/threonine-protein kinase
MTGKLARSQRLAPGSSSGDGRSLIKVGDLLASKYRVERVLGEGGMGVVVEAYHELLDQRVAVKLLWQDIADQEAQKRLLLEARSAAKLQSDHVARVIDVDVGADGLPFIVMELLEGSDLCEIADTRGALPRWLVVDYVLQALEGLAHAHGRGIIHRDLKPSNLFLATCPDGRQVLKILDFGISKSPEAQDRRAKQLTGGLTVLGSPPYMSPEQIRTPKAIDHRTDIWSLGVSMYELLTNGMPFGGDEVQETFANILEVEPAPVRSVVTGVPEGLEQVVMKCLAKNRDDRYADVGELAKALVPYGSGSWIQSAERVASTLARAQTEGWSSLNRMPPVGSSGVHGIPVPSSRRLDSLQPELNGTASTVGHRVSVLEAKKRVIVGVCVAMITAGILLIATSLLRPGGLASIFHRSSAPAATAVDLGAPVPAPAPLPAASLGVVDPGAMPSAPVTASVENDLPTSPLPAATVLGASPVAPVLPSVPTASAARARSVPVPTYHHGKLPQAAPPPPPRPSTPSTPPGLPPGLPQTRSGQ